MTAPISNEPAFEIRAPDFREILLADRRSLAAGVGPMLAFYVWKLAGLVPGILAATVVALLAWRHERRHDRPGLDGAPVARHGRAATLEALLKG